MIGAIIILIFILGILVFSHESGHFIAAKLSKVRVEEFGLGMFVRIFSFKKGETTYSLNAIPIGGFVKITGEDSEVPNDPGSFSEKPKLNQIFILGAGVFVNFLLATLIMIITFWVGMPNWGSRVKIDGVDQNSPAQTAGIQKGDIITKIGEQTVETSDSLSTYTQQHLNQDVALTLLRDNQTVLTTVFLRGEHAETEGPMGVEIKDEIYVSTYETYGFWDGIKRGVKTAVDTSSMIIQGIYGMFRDLIVKREAPSDVSGPVGIGQIVFELKKFGFRPILQFAGILSLNLTIVNLLPLPALDGGRIIFVIIEAVTRRKIPSYITQWVNAAGMVLLLILMVLITFRDILRVFHP